MNTDVFISEVEFLIIIVVGLLLARQFYLSKNGILRKLLIAYFLIDVYVYIMGGLYVYFVVSGMFHMSDALFRFIVLTPKVIIKIRLYFYLIGLNKARK